MSHILHTSTVHKTAPLAHEVNSAYSQWKLALQGHLNTDAQVRDCSDFELLH